MKRIFDIKNKSRVQVAFIFIAICLILLIIRLSYIQIVNAGFYKDKAISQQRDDIEIKAKRGAILDRKGKELALTTKAYKIWVMPNAIKNEYSKEENEGSNKKAKAGIKDLNKVVMELSNAINKKKTPEEILESINKNEKPHFLKVEVDEDSAEKIRKLDFTGVSLKEITKRKYPMGDLASVVLGSLNNDGVGRSGVEYYYNDYLSGVNGRWLKDKDILGNTLTYGENKKYFGEDGDTVKLTIDEVLQHYLEKSLVDAKKKYKADRIWGMALDPKNGEILAMSQQPSFDPNNPFVPTGKENKKIFDKMEEKEQSKYLNRLWRNPLVSDAYEPGSTFKLLVSSAMLEDELATPDTYYNCNQYINVAGVKLHCWSPTAHGKITLKEAVGVSCNPAHVEMARQMGKTRFYNFLNQYGVMENTGVDLPAEASPIVLPKKNVGPVELATMGFGQGIAVTPIQMTSIIGALGNGGIYNKPHIMKEIIGPDGKTIKKASTDIEKKIVSKKTSKEVLSIMEAEVKEYGGKNARIPGYKIGGKTGTANVTDGKGKYKYDRSYCSFVCLAPIDDPKIAVLVVMDVPWGSLGGFTAAPTVKDFLEKALPYMEIPKDKSDEKEGTKDAKEIYSYVPDVKGKSLKEAMNLLESQGLGFRVKPDFETKDIKEKEETKIVDQYPKGGSKVETGSKVYLYRK